MQPSKNLNAIPKPSISTCKNPRATLDYAYYGDSNCRVLTSVNQLRLGKESIKKIRFGGQEIRFATDKLDRSNLFSQSSRLLVRMPSTHPRP